MNLTCETPRPGVLELKLPRFGVPGEPIVVTPQAAHGLVKVLRPDGRCLARLREGSSVVVVGEPVDINRKGWQTKSTQLVWSVTEFNSGVKLGIVGKEGFCTCDRCSQ
jgi:hypothetical protein